jgi:hypothetical protein
MIGKQVADQEIHLGEKVMIEGPSPAPPFVAVFEDDGDTGYFYAVDRSRNKNLILDALHIYNVAQITDRKIPSTVKIVWSMDDKKAALLINGFPHAVFDFNSRRGYCRDGFPPPNGSDWSRGGHHWDDVALQYFEQQEV